MPIFRQNFRDDFSEAIAGLLPNYCGEPYALARWADGEAAVAFGRPYTTKADGWSWPTGKRNLLSETLLDSLGYVAPGWHVGITAESHHQAEHRKLMKYVGVPLDRITFAEIFIFANYRRWKRLREAIETSIIVGPGGHYDVPRLAVEQDWLWHETADRLVHEADRPILVAAGPLANAIIYEYWRRSAGEPENRQVILDLGSVLSLKLHHRPQRMYQVPGRWERRWSPAWKLDEKLTEEKAGA